MRDLFQARQYAGECSSTGFQAIIAVCERVGQKQWLRACGKTVQKAIRQPQQNFVLLPSHMWHRYAACHCSLSGKLATEARSCLSGVPSTACCIMFAHVVSLS